ncbi:MAG: VTT domain-containing protein [Paracoccaceae bacterium]|nr:VTT domain-containing protein [Paracoccaceae bacterium]
MQIKKYIIPLSIVIIAIVGFTLLRDYLSYETLRNNHESLVNFKNENYWVTVIIFIISYITLVTFALPGSPIASLTGGFLFGLAFGTFLNVTAAATGATLIFLAAKNGFGNKLTQRIDASEGSIRKIRDGIKRDEISYLFLIRLIPIIPFAVANLVPALFGVSLRNFFFTTYIGIIPGGLVFTWLGSGLSEIFKQNEEPNFSIIFEIYVIGPILCLCLLSFLPIILKKLGIIKNQNEQI